jgi:hypothetical protein
MSVLPADAAFRAGSHQMVDYIKQYSLTGK